VSAPETASATAKGWVVALCIGTGGIPKRPVDHAQLGPAGLQGDRSRNAPHGGPDRALCLLSSAEITSMANDGVPVAGPGAFGENLVYAGIEPAELRPGDQLAIGDEAVVELSDVREPCLTLKRLDRRFPDLMLGRSGFMARVLRPGRIAAGQVISRLAPPDRLR
jgi:MOSC domain-containing protein YiiM